MNILADIRNRTHGDCAVEGMASGVLQLEHQALVHYGYGNSRQQNVRDQRAEAKVESSIGGSSLSSQLANIPQAAL